jgi:hypothetical protein
MVGLAASMSRPSTCVDALGEALAARGPDLVRHQIGATTLLVRAALPIVHEVGGCFAAVDGIAELSTLVSAYHRMGPAGLLGGAQAYALILCDPARDGLVLVRNGDGPPLYYAWTGKGALVASEPEALLAAGVPADPERAVMAAFLAAGACDETAQTFYAAIRRVLPGQALTLTPEELVDHTPAVHEPRLRRPVSARLALRWATAQGRIGVRLGAGASGAAILGAALARMADGVPLPVYANRFPGLSGAVVEHATALVGSLPSGAVRYRAIEFSPRTLRLDAFLADVGEPLPDLESYLIWATAEATAGEVDALLDAAAPADHLSRLADRIGSRYGVELRFPRCRTPDDTQWPSIARETLPGRAGRYGASADDRMALYPPTGEVLREIGPELTASMLHGQPRGEVRQAIEELGALLSGRQADADVLYRRHVLAHWMRRHRRRTTIPAARTPATTAAAGRDWRCVAVETGLLRPGVPIAETLAWYIAEALGRERIENRPWHLLVAAKPVAVAQGRVAGVWEIRPRRAARTVAALRGTAPWVEQVVIDHSGALRALGAALARRIRFRFLERRLITPAMEAVSAPRPDAAEPAHISVVVAPRHGDEVAQELLDMLAKVLTEVEWAALAGCAVLGADEYGARLAGWASGPGSTGEVDRETAIALACGNPFGQDDRRTPVVLAIAEPIAAGDRKPAESGGRHA